MSAMTVTPGRGGRPREIEGELPVGADRDFQAARQVALTHLLEKRGGDPRQQRSLDDEVDVPAPVSTSDSVRDLSTTRVVVIDFIIQGTLLRGSPPRFSRR